MYCGCSLSLSVGQYRLLVRGFLGVGGRDRVIEEAGGVRERGTGVEKKDV